MWAAMVWMVIIAKAPQAPAAPKECRAAVLRGLLLPSPAIALPWLFPGCSCRVASCCDPLRYVVDAPAHPRFHVRNRHRLASTLQSSPSAAQILCDARPLPDINPCVIAACRHLARLHRPFQRASVRPAHQRLLGVMFDFDGPSRVFVAHAILRMGVNFSAFASQFDHDCRQPLIPRLVPAPLPDT